MSILRPLQDRIQLARVAGLVTAAVLLTTSCGGDGSESGSSDAKPTSPTADALSYELEDRRDFLLSTPDCDQLRKWYEVNPSDDQLDVVAAFVESCEEVPDIVTAAPEMIANDLDLVSLMLDERFGPEHPVRLTAYGVVSQAVCGMFEDDVKSLWQVQNDLRKEFDVDPQAATSIVEHAVEHECAEYENIADDFSVVDISHALEQLKKHLNSTHGGVVAGTPDDEIAALAQMTCSQLQDGVPLAEASMMFGYLVGDFGTAGGETDGRKAVDLFCPEAL